VYALYNLNKFTVRFATKRTEAVDRAYESAIGQAEERSFASSSSSSWILLSETGGRGSSLSYPLRSTTQDFLYMGFQNLMDGWILDREENMAVAPQQKKPQNDGNSNQNTSTNTANTATTANTANATITTTSASGDNRERNRQGRRIQGYWNSGGDSTGEPPYNLNVGQQQTTTGMQAPGTNSAATPSTASTTGSTTGSTTATTATTITTATNASKIPEPIQTIQTSVPTSVPTAKRTTVAPTAKSTTVAPTTLAPTVPAKPPKTEPPKEVPTSQYESSYVNMFEGLVYHKMYDHLVTVDLRVKLHLRTDKLKNQNGKRERERSLRSLQGQGSSSNADNEDGEDDGDDDGDDDDGHVELLAEMIPTIAFLEPVGEEQKKTKPTNDDVREIYGGWMEFLFGIQRDIYLRTLVSHPTQELLQRVTKLKVEVSAGRSPAASTVAAEDPNNAMNGYTDDWSERTKNSLITMLVILAIVALVWPMYAWHEHHKRDRELRLQLINTGASLDGDLYSDGFSSVTYRDDPSHSSFGNNPNPNPNNIYNDHKAFAGVGGHSSLPRPIPLTQRAYSLDSPRHGADVFPSANSRRNATSTASAISAIEASNRYLSRHRPDLFYDQHRSDTNGSVSVFGRVYEIPSNPFEYIYKGYFQNQSENTQQQGAEAQQVSPVTTNGHDLGRQAHFPFSSPGRSSFAGRSVSVGSGGSNGNAGANNVHSASHFAPIQNLAAGAGGEEYEDGEGRRDEATGFAASHTGHSWQNHAAESGQQSPQPSGTQGDGTEGGPVSLVGTIFRNLSMSSWYSSTNSNSNNNYSVNASHYTDVEFNPTYSSGQEEIYYDDYQQKNNYQYQDPALYEREIEMETLPNVDEEDPSNYNFAFRDFPRRDGTPCLIFDEEEALSERKRRECAKMIFSIDDDDDGMIYINDDDDDEDNDNDGLDNDSLSEKKLDYLAPLSDVDFQRMLSQNSLKIDDSSQSFDAGDADSVVVPPLVDSFLNPEKEPVAKSQEFQDKLRRLMETKQERYTKEKKNAAIVAEKRKKRKNVRDKERVDRHKAIERELEDIEAEFSLTVQPRSPTRNNTNHVAIGIPGSPKNPGVSTARLSPMPGARFSPMPSRYSTASPVPVSKNSIATMSPGRAMLGRGGGSGHSRNHSMGNHTMGGDHRRLSSMEASPFRRFSPRTRYPQHKQSKSSSGSFHGGDIFRQESPAGDVSPPVGLADLDAPLDEYKVNFRPVNLHGSDRLSGSQHGRIDDLSLPAMKTAEGTIQGPPHDMKFPSPQAVIDEAMHGDDPLPKNRHAYTNLHHRQRSRTPTRSTHSAPSQQFHLHRRVNSFDVDESVHRTIRKTGSFGTSPAKQQQQQLGGSNSSHHRRSVSSSVVSSTNRPRSNSQQSLGGGGSIGGSSHRRTPSQSDDVFLHGVVAQTRFV